MHVKRSMPALLLALAGLVGAVGAVEADVNVRHRLEVETSNGKVLVRVTIENHGEQTIWVPREVAAEDELTGRRFDLREARGGKAVDYVGPMVKRGPYTAADYLAVEPHTMHLNTIDITRAYAFKQGRHGYEVRYAGPWLLDVGKLDEQKQSPSEPVRFSFNRP
ncbi:hypothetical protein [Massilia niastensis]|uniref:hypothetical protein n=1 Tax=Massilia niastensis TaxID=544911 RepID=UPI0003A6B94E|nr:hypothetical protein [Massilia niastensis]